MMGLGSVSFSVLLKNLETNSHDFVLGIVIETISYITHLSQADMSPHSLIQGAI